MKYPRRYAGADFMPADGGAKEYIEYIDEHIDTIHMAKQSR